MSSEEPDDAPGAPPLPDEELNLTDPKAMRALAHPVRMALLELIGVAGTITATQASEVLGESPANCAFHLRTLAKYGLIREAGGGRGRERPWTRSQRSLRISATGQTSTQAALAAGALGRAWFEHWVERARRAIGTNTRVPGWENVHDFSRSSLFLTPQEAAAFEDELEQMINRYRGRERDPSLRPAGSLPVEFVSYLSPLPELAPIVDKTRDIS
jgi:predicted transcriptional regulator